MEDRELLGTPNTRRANRFNVSRPIKLIRPVKARGRTVNVSAVGMLVRLTQTAELRIGDVVAMEITRADGQATMTIKGKVVRVDYSDDRIQFAVDLAPLEPVE
mgnify:CR=1 FL=1